MARRNKPSPEAKYHCPICGALNVYGDSFGDHHCPPSTYRAIDAANTRAINRENKESDYPIPWFFGSKMAQGFAWLFGKQDIEEQRDDRYF